MPDTTDLAAEVAELRRTVAALVDTVTALAAASVATGEAVTATTAAVTQQGGNMSKLLTHLDREQDRVEMCVRLLPPPDVDH